MINDLLKYGEVLEDASLEHYNTYGIKTSCKYLVKPSSIDNLLLLLNYIKDNNMRYYIIGKGSNIILPDTKLDGIIISLELLNKITFNNNIAKVESGASLAHFARETINKGLSGLEYIATIPGTVGGALYGNAGVKDHEIYDNIIYVEVIRNNELIKLNRNDIEVSYRHTEFKNTNDIIVSGTFELKDGNLEEMNNIVKENREKRLNTQPLEYKNAGSVFKNPEGNYAGKLVEELGLKGYKIGDAQVSMKHANFIVNLGNATSKDIKELIKLIKDKVYERYNIELELEQIVIDWD